MSRLTLSRFDFDFTQWPIDFRWNDSQMTDNKKAPQLLSSGRHSRRTIFLSIPCDIINYLVVTTIGRRMLYPGSVSLLQLAISGALQEGRTKLVEQDSGERYKLLARDNNHIDCMFVDRRIRDTERCMYSFMTLCELLKYLMFCFNHSQDISDLQRRQRRILRDRSDDHTSERRLFSARLEPPGLRWQHWSAVPAERHQCHGCCDKVRCRTTRLFTGSNYTLRLVYWRLSSELGCHGVPGHQRNHFGRLVRRCPTIG